MECYNEENDVVLSMGLIFLFGCCHVEKTVNKFLIGTLQVTMLEKEPKHISVVQAMRSMVSFHFVTILDGTKYLVIKIKFFYRSRNT